MTQLPAMHTVAVSVGRFLEHTFFVVAGFVLMVVGLGLGVTMVMLPVGLVLGLVGVAMVVGGIFARIDAAEK